MNFLFKHDAPLVPGEKLIGHLQWAAPIQIEMARFVCLAPYVERTVIELTVNGELTGKQIVIDPVMAGQRISLVVPMQHIAPVNAEVRFQCVSGPAHPANAIRLVGLTITFGIASTEVSPASQLTVRWVKGKEELPLFNYVPATHSFTETSSGISAGRASIVNVTNLIVQIESVTAMQFANNALQVNQALVIGGTGTMEGPRLEFLHGVRRLATLTKAGVLRLVDLIEEPNPQGGSDRFEFFGGGNLIAALAPAGAGQPPALRVQQLSEPIV